VVTSAPAGPQSDDDPDRERILEECENFVNDAGWFFPVPDDAQLSDGLRRLFGKARDSIGFVPNVFRLYAFRQERFSAWFAHYRQLHEPTANLSAADREMIAVVVSAANRCLYCLVAHGAQLRTELDDAVTGDRITFDWRRAGLADKQAAICAFAEKLTVRPVECSASDLAGLQKFGLTDEEVWDVVEIASMYNFTNRMSMATGIRANEEYHAQGRT
jgi:uncharacterized peroxidase-related enzyme